MARQSKWKSFSEEEIRKIVSDSCSDREVAGKLGYNKDAGGTRRTIHKMYEELNIDTSHFKGQGWSKDDFDYSSFKKFSHKKNGASTAKVLIKLRGQKCECCGLTEWLNQPINLEVHHINGDRTDNSLENLQLLCPNCHSYTPTFARRGDKREKTEEEFVQALKDSESIRQALIKLDLTPAGGNYDRAYELIYKYDIDHLKKSTNKGNLLSE